MDNSNTVVAHDRDIMDNSNSIVWDFELKRQISNAVVSHDKDIADNSNAIFLSNVIKKMY